MSWFSLLLPWLCTACSIKESEEHRMWSSLQSEEPESTMASKSFSSRSFFAVALVAVGLLLLGFIIGWFSKPTSIVTLPNSYPSARKAFWDEMKAENIKEFLRNFTRLPHLAGTEQNLLLAKQIQAQWKEFGLDSAELAHYDVLLSYPNESDPNYISIIDEHGNEIFKTSLSESTPEGYENITDIVPPFNAYSMPGVPEVKNAQLAGAKGIILYSDPADYCAPGVDPYPHGWNLPGDGVQREYAFRYGATEGVGLPKIPVHPIGYHDAEKLLRNMGGPAPPNSWKGNLNVSYNIGPGFTANYSTQKVRMHIHTINRVTRIYNVIGTLKGALEQDRYVILGGHRDSWVFGGIDPQSGAAVVHEIVRSAGKLMKTERHEDVGTGTMMNFVTVSFSNQSPLERQDREMEVRENVKILQARGVAYINADSSVEGNYTLRVDCTPLMYSLAYNLTRELPSPDETFEGKSLYESWHQKDNWTEYRDAPRINKLGSGNDFEVFFQRLGISSGRTRYTKNRKEGRYSGYPVYHSVYETFELVEKFYDPTFKTHLAVAQVRGGLVFELADSVVLPFRCRDYAEALKCYADTIYTLARKHQARLEMFNVSFDPLFSAVSNFSQAALAFDQKVKSVDTNNPLLIRSINDQLMFLERAFIDPLGLPGTPFYRHIIFAPSSHNKYAGESFPGIYDAMFNIGNKTDQKAAWEEVKRQISIATFTIQAAAGTLE